MKTNKSLIVALITTFVGISYPVVRAEEVKTPVKEEQKETPKPYKLDTCLVSGEKLGEMGEPFVFIHEGQEIKMCCKMCKPKFDKEPAKYLKKLEGK